MTTHSLAIAIGILYVSLVAFRLGQPLEKRPWTVAWVAVLDEPLFKVENLDGLYWHEADPPPKRHEHTAQTRWWKNLEYGEMLRSPLRLHARGRSSRLGGVPRCACGAFGDRGGWFFARNDKPRVASRPSLLTRIGL